MDTIILENGLSEDRYQLIILPYKPDADALEISFYGQENLAFALPPNHRLAKKATLSFRDMDDENMIVLSQIGFRHELVVKEMPHSRFHMQNDRIDFEELIHASTLPFFAA